MDNFKGEIIWNRAFAHNDAKKKLAVLSDAIWYYSKSGKFIYNPVYSMTNEENYNERFNLADENGRPYQSVPMDSPNPRPNMMYEWKGYPYPPKGWQYSKETMEELDQRGEIIYPENPKGRLRRKNILMKQKGHY
jgi:site-specific DNA-methyltransferase (adenine-specific)